MDAAAWDERYLQKELVWTGEVNRFVADHLGTLEPGTAIDLGAGEGRNAVWLAQRGWTVTAVDFSPVGLAKARQLAEEAGVTIETAVADALHYEPDEPVDLVVLSYLQVDPEQRERILRNASGWLRPGGTLFVIAHDKSNVEHGHGGPPSAVMCYDVDETVAALGGAVVTKAGVVERPVETDDGIRIALDTLVIAVRQD
jgi:SAM-dependent methyltransferase